MANQEISEETVLYKTLTSIEKLKDGSCIKKITETKNGITDVKQEKIDCDTAMHAVHEKEDKDEENFRRENEKFDNKMREKLREMNKQFSEEDNKKIKTKEENISDGKNKLVKVTRESSSIEETKKTEKIPEGTKRTLKITRESFLEETNKSMKPGDPTEEGTQENTVLDESFAEIEEEKAHKEEKETDELNNSEVERLQKSTLAAKESDTEETNIGQLVNKTDPDEKETDVLERMEIAEADDGLIKKFMKTVMSILLYPLSKLGIL